MYLQIIFLIILIGVILTFFKYSKEGDILTLKGKCPSVEKLLASYPSRTKIIERMHDLLIYKDNYVRWNSFLIIAMFVSLVVLYFTREKIQLSEFIILTCFIFLAIDLPNRWANAHIYKGVTQEATQLQTLFLTLSQ